MKKIRAAITAVGGWLPETVLSNAELEKMVDTTDEWIISRTGIKERRIMVGKERGTSEIGINAVKQILDKKGIDPLDIDLLIVGTVTPDYVFPSTSNLICSKLGMKNTWGFDLSAACSGFLYALSTATQFIESGRYKKVFVVGADKMSSIINYEDRATCVIFGDGGGAVLLEPTEEEVGVMDFILHADGSGAQFLNMKAGGIAQIGHDDIQLAVSVEVPEGGERGAAWPPSWVQYRRPERAGAVSGQHFEHGGIILRQIVAPPNSFADRKRQR